MRESRAKALLVVTLTVGSVLCTLSWWASTASADGDRPKNYPTNASGQTYGRLATAGSGSSTADEDLPDLVSVLMDQGGFGYAYRDEIDQPASQDPATPQEALALGQPKPRVVPVYEADGTTQIGTFTVNRTD